MPELLELESNWTNIGEKAWSKEQFEKELPGKWDLSVFASFNNKIVGYAICSIDSGYARLNKILIDTKFRGKGIATLLWDKFIEKAKKLNLNKLELKVYVNNDAVEFYKKKGCLYYGFELGPDNRLRHLAKYVFQAENRIKHSKPTIDFSDINAVVGAMVDGEIATGSIVNEFEKELSNHIGRNYALATTNGSSAMHLALRALNIGLGDEVILPSYVCISVLSAIKNCNATPILCDINEDDYNISINEVKRKITKSTKAIILVHMFGNPVNNVKDFLDLNIPIIEDCAHSIGAKINNKNVGSFGLISVFSFYATKMMTTGSGGMVLTDDKNIIQKLKDLTTYDNKEEYSENYNYKMSDIQAALGINQIRKLNDFINRRKKIASRYFELLKNIEPPNSNNNNNNNNSNNSNNKTNSNQFQHYKENSNNTLNNSSPNNQNNQNSPNTQNTQNNQDNNIFYRYIIKDKMRDHLIKIVNNAGVDIAIPVKKALHTYLNQSDDEYPNSTKACKEALSLPIYPNLTDSEVETVAGILTMSKVL